MLRGYSFTAVAFAHSLAPDVVNLVNTWPNYSTGKASAEKVPTAIRYTNVRTRTYRWGYEVVDANSADTLRWLKLLLQPHPESNLLQPWNKLFGDAPRKTSVKPLQSLVDGPSVIRNKSNYFTGIYFPTYITSTPNGLQTPGASDFSWYCDVRLSEVSFRTYKS